MSRNWCDFGESVPGHLGLKAWIIEIPSMVVDVPSGHWVLSNGKSWSCKESEAKRDQSNFCEDV